jgi:hypothetical protein
MAYSGAWALPTDEAAARDLSLADTVAVYIDLPNLAGYPTPIEKARFLLDRAAEIEHSLLVQYLYAAYSLKKPADGVTPQQKAALSQWFRLIFGIAKEEMGHLMTVQNLLLLVGQPPNFERERFPVPPEIYPFPMHLEPLTQASLSKYVVAESPVDATGIEDIIRQATHEVGAAPNRVGALYALLGVVFTRDGELESNAAGGDKWYQTVRDVGHLAFLQDPGSRRWHLPDTAFDAGSLARQARGEDWAATGMIRVKVAGDRRAALDALRDISLQGEGPVQPIADPLGSHFERFRRIYRGESLLPYPAGDWTPTRGVPKDPIVGGPSGSPNVIRAPKAKDYATLANERYALLLGFLEQYFLTEPASRTILKDWCIGEMRWLGGLALVLSGLPRDSKPTEVAAIPFRLPQVLHLSPEKKAQWQVHIDRLSRAVALLTKMLGSHSAGDRQLQRILDEDKKHLVVARQMKQGRAPALTGWARVQQILDSASGTGTPYHDGHGRFWNLPLAEFVQLTIYSLPLIAPAGRNRGRNSNLVKALRAEPPFDGSEFVQMPLGRPQVPAQDISFIEQWIDNGCPVT